MAENRGASKKQSIRTSVESGELVQKYPPSGKTVDDGQNLTRRVVGYAGLALPIFCYAYSAIAYTQARPGSPVFLGSVSEYFHTYLLTYFTATLACIGLALYGYRGYSKTEDLLSTLGGFAALTVGLCPTGSTRTALGNFIRHHIGPNFTMFVSGMHGLFAVILFGIFLLFSGAFFVRTVADDRAYPLSREADESSWITAKRSIRSTWCVLIQTLFWWTPAGRERLFGDPKALGRNRMFIGTTWTLLVSILVCALMGYARTKIDGDALYWQDYVFLAAESVAILAFAVAWLVKSYSKT